MFYSLPRFKHSFTWFFLTISSFLLFCSLGAWQIKRAQEKQEIIANYKKHVNENFKFWQKADKLPQQAEKLKLRGKFLPIIFYLDNQHYQHQFGYNVLRPLLLEDGSIVIVDRGWIAVHSRKTVSLPEQIIKKHINIAGYTYYPASKKIILGDNLEKIDENHVIIETPDVTVISNFLHHAVQPFIIRVLDVSQGLQANWQLVSMLPERHYAYALQWFALAILVVIIYVSLNLKVKK